MKTFLATLGLGLVQTSGVAAAAKDAESLNVSCDPTREFHAEVNRTFAAQWKQQTGETLTTRASHRKRGACRGGSSPPAFLPAGRLRPGRRMSA